MKTSSILRRSPWLAAGLLLFATAAGVRAEDAAPPPEGPKPAPEPPKPAPEAPKPPPEEPKPAPEAPKPAPEEPKPAPEAPKPEPGPKSEAGRRWMLDFKHGNLKRVLVDDGTGRETTYLYMRMTVSNKTGFARPWRPIVTAKVDTRPEPYVAGGFATALDRIRLQEAASGLEPVETTGWKKGDDGKIADGTTKDLVAIFGPVDPGWNTFRIEVHGLVNPITTLKVRKYGDKQVVMEAAYAERNAKVMADLKAAAKASGSELPAPTAEYQEVLENRAFVIDYRRMGDEFRPDDDLIEFVGERWEVIGEPKIIRTIPASV